MNRIQQAKLADCIMPGGNILAEGIKGDDIFS
jgi:hypothetical protein